MLLWAAYLAVGFGDRAALPALRSDAADRLVGRDQPVSWLLAFLHLVAESARAGLRTLDRLEEAAGEGGGLAAAADKRSRLPDAVDALLRVPVLTPEALAARLGIAQGRDRVSAVALPGPAARVPPSEGWGWVTDKWPEQQPLAGGQQRRVAILVFDAQQRDTAVIVDRPGNPHPPSW